ncbi:MAG: PAS domain S-box protein [Verrucomicrobiota bacterium]
MRKLFPYLTQSNIKSLFVSQKVSRGKSIGPSDSTEYIEADIGEVDLDQLPQELYESFGRLVKAGTGFPCLFICDASGKVIWESSERAFEIEAVEKDILRHLNERTGTEIGEIKRLAAYPDGVTENPLDGVIRFGVVVPLSFGDDLVGALCGVNDSEMSLSVKLRQQLDDASSLLLANLEANAFSLQARLETEALEEIQVFLKKGWGEAFLAMLCKKLAKIADVEWAFVVNFDSSGEPEGKTVSAIFQGVSVENFTYNINASPLIDLKGPELVVISEGVAEEFPDDEKIQEEEIESFASIGLINAAGKLSRALVLMGRRPFENEGVIAKILEAVAPRAAAEMDGIKRQENDEQLVQVQEQRFERLFQNDGIGIIIVGGDGRIEAANSTLLESLQYSKQEITGKKYADLCAIKEDPKEVTFRQECIDGRRIGYQIEKTYLRSDQSQLNGLASVTAMPGNEDEMVFLETVRDLSDEHAAAHELQSLENKFELAESERHSLFHSSPNPLAKVNQRGEVLDANGAWLHVLGYGLVEVKGLDLAELVAGDEGQQQISAVLKEGVRQTTDILNVQGKQGDPLRAAFIFSPVEHSQTGQKYFIVGLKDSTLEEEQSRLVERSIEGMQSLSELPGLALAWLDDHAGFIRASHEIEEVLMRKMSELGSMTLFDVVSGDAEEEVRRGLKCVAAGEQKVFQWECTMAYPGKQEVHVELSVIRIADQGNGEAFLMGCRNRTDEQLFEREALTCKDQLDGMVEGLGQGVIFADSSGKLLRANPVAEVMLGSSAEQLKGKSLYAWVPEAEQQRLNQRLEASDPGKQFSLALEIENAGQQIPVKLTGRSVNAWQETSGSLWILFLEDRRESHGREQELAELSNQLAAVELHAGVLQNIQNTGICIVRPDGRVTDANEYLESRLGYSIEAETVQLTDLIDQGIEQEVLVHGLADCLAGKRELFNFQGKLNRRDQQEVWVDLCLHLVKDDDGIPLYLIAAWYDKTKLIESEDRWQGVDAPVRELINSSHSGLVFLDEDLKVTDVNPAMCRILDASEEKIKGQLISEFIAKEDQEVGQACFRKVESNESLKLIGRAGELRNTRVTVKKFGTGERGDKVWYLILVKLQEAEAKLEAEAIRWRRRFETLFDRKDVPMGLCDEKGQLLEANQGLVELTGMDREALRYKAWSDYMVEQKWELPEVMNGDPIRFESVFSFDGKREISGRLFVQQVVADGDGTGAHYTWLLQDVSEEIQARDWGNLRNARLKAFLANPVVGLAVLDQGGQILEANNMFEEFFEQKTEVSVGKNIKQWLPEKDQEPFVSEWSALEEGGRSRFQLDVTVEVAGDDMAEGEEPQTKLSRLTVVLLDAEEPTGFAVVLLEDLTELKQTRTSLEQTNLHLQETEQQMTRDLEEKTGELEESRQLLQEKQTEYDGVATELAARQVDLDHLNVVKAELEEKNTAQSKLFTEKEEACQYLEEQLKTSSEKCEALEQEIADYQQQVETYEAEKGPSLQEIMRDSEVALVVINEKRLIHEVNSAFGELIEYRGDELREQKLDEVLGLTLDEEQLEIVQSVFDGKVINFQMEVPVLMRDQTYRWLRISGSRINQHDREQYYCILVVENVTPQYDAESQLGVAEQRFLALAESSSIGVLMVDAEGVIFFSNPAMNHFLGESEDGLAGKTLNDFVHQDDPKEDLQLDERCLQGEIDDYQIEKMLMTSAGKLFWARINVKVIRFANGDFWYTVRTIEDLTGMHQAADKLARTEGRLGKIFQASDAAVLLMDRRSQIMEVSAGASKLFGSESKEVIRKKLNDMGKDDAEQSFGNLFSMLEGGEVKEIRIEDEVVDASGECVDVLAVLHAVLDEDGNFESAVASIQEITPEKEPEAKLPEVAPVIDEEDEDKSLSTEKPEFKVAPLFVERGKTEIIPQIPSEMRDPDKPSTRTQALMDSVRVSESQRIDSSKISVPKPLSLQKEHLRPSAALNEGWVLADDSGRVVMLNRVAAEILGTEREQALLKPLAEVLHIKDQKAWHVPSAEMDAQMTEASLRESIIWDYHRETKTLIHMSQPVLNGTRKMAGTVVVFVPLESIEKLPGYQEDKIADSYKKCSKEFMQFVEKLQAWVEEELQDYLDKCLRLNQSDLAVEASIVEEKLKK